MSQLAFTYSANRRAARPFSLLFTSLSGRLHTRLEGTSDASYKRWIDTEWWEEGYEKLWEDPKPPTNTTIEPSSTAAESKPVAGPSSTPAADVSDSVKGKGKKRSPNFKPRSRATKESVVYLTADSPDELTELKEGETYIIGGIVDHNRYKVRNRDLCYT